MISLGFFIFAAKLAPVGYGIKKLVINCVIEDDKVSTDDLEERITGFEDFVSLLYMYILYTLVFSLQRRTLCFDLEVESLRYSP